MTSFSKEEIAHYSRHLILPEFNIEGQRKLKEASVLVVGAGGLGSPLLQYLAAAGVGTIGIIDPDRVDASNLHRQVLYGMSEIGMLKVEAAYNRLKDLNPHIDFACYPARLTSQNAREIISGYDVVADGTDNFPTRYLVNDACVLMDKVNVYASIYRYEGQVSVFNYVDSQGNRGPNYRDLYPTPPPPDLVPNCAEGGVLGVLPGIIGSIQASEVIKVITGLGDPLVGRLFLFDAWDFSTRILKLSINPDNPLTGDHPQQKELIDYEAFCGVVSPTLADSSEEMLHLTVEELALWRKNNVPHELIDVREPYEYEIVNLKGKLIPLDHIIDRVNEIDWELPVIVHCRTGVRSAKALKTLQQRFPKHLIYNLKGGIIAYAKHIDNDLPVY